MKTVVLLLSVVCLCFGATSTTIARDFEANFGARPTGAEVVLDIVVTGLENNKPYNIQETAAQSLPFSVDGNRTNLVPQNGRLNVKVKFTTLAKGTYIRKLTILPAINPTQNEGAVIICSAFAFSPEPPPVNFGTVPTGDSIVKFIPLRELAREFDFSALEFNSTELLPFYILNENAVREENGNEFGFNIAFAPVEKKPFTSVLSLERTAKNRPKEIIDTIRIELVGIGRGLNLSLTPQFEPTLTYDVQKKTSKVDRLQSRATKYVVADRVKPPFTIITNFDDFLDNGREIVEYSFNPTEAGTYLDTLVLHRVKRVGNDNRIFDIVEIVFQASAVAMNKVEKFNLGTFNVDSVNNQSLTVPLPVQPIGNDFLYKFSDSTNIVAAKVIAPTDFSKENEISFQVRATSSAPFKGIQRLTLYRFNSSREAIDSSVLEFEMNIVSRPYRVQARTDQEVYLAKIGDTVQVDVLLNAPGVSKLNADLPAPECTIAYNPSVLIPVGDESLFRVSTNDTASVVQFSNGINQRIQFTKQGQVVASQKFVVALGNADSSTLDLQTCEIDTESILDKSATCTGGVVRVGNVYIYQDGRKRLVNSLAEQLVLEIDPNPVVDVSTLIIGNHAANNSSLTIVNNVGSIVADLTQEVRNGKTEFRVGRSGSIALSPGSYTARLTVQTQSGKTLSSIVRLFVVQ